MESSISTANGSVRIARLMTMAAACMTVVALQAGVASAAGYSTSVNATGTSDADARLQFISASQIACAAYGSVDHYTISSVTQQAAKKYSAQGTVWCTGS